MIEPVLTGVRLALIALYCVVFWRLIFFNWKITAQLKQNTSDLI